MRDVPGGVRILMDLQSMASESAGRGVGQYALALAGGLDRRDDVELMVLLNRVDDDDALLEARAAVSSAAPGATIHTVLAPWPWPGAVYDGPAHRVAAAVRREFVRQLAPDVVLVDNVFEPPFSSVHGGADDFSPVPTAAILHDLIPLEHPDRAFDDADFAADYRRRMRWLAEIPLLLSNSEHTASAARELADIDADRLVVIGGGPGPISRLAPREGGTTPPRAGRSGLVFVSADDERKNELGLMEAFAQLPTGLRQRHPLVLVGRRSAATLSRISASRKRLGLGREEVLSTGRLEDADLADLYARSRAVVMPSFAEGLGLPVLEAWAFGTPVVASDRTSLPELVGRPDALFDPTDTVAMATVLSRILTDDAWWDELRTALDLRRREFAWDRSAAVAAEALTRLARSTPGAVVPASRRPSLALVTPWSPQSTGIARHADVMVGALSAHYEVTVVTDPANHVPGGVPSLSPTAFLASADRFDRVLFQMGNSPFHDFMLPLLAQVPGVVVMHDARLVEWLRYALGADSDAYRDLAYRERGLQGWRDAELTGVELVRASLGLLVHSAGARDQLVSGRGALPADYVRIAPLVDLGGDRPDRATARRDLGVADDDVVVATFGRVHPMKRTREFLDALDSVRGQAPVRIAVVGGDSDAGYMAEVRRRAGEVGATVTGDIGHDTYATWLAATDIAVQLRAEDHGESSAALIDAMAGGACVVVEAVGSMPETIRDAGVVVDSPVRVDDLASTVAGLVKDGDRRLALAQAAADLARTRHGVDAAGAAYAEVVEAHYGRRDPKDFISTVAAASVDGPRAQQALACAAENRADRASPRLVLDMSELTGEHALTGIQRVQQRLADHLVDAWDGRLVHAALAPRGLVETRAAAGGSTVDDGTPLRARPGDWLFSGRFFPDAEKWERRLADWRASGGRVAHVIYDILPLTHPQWFPAFAADYFPRYLEVVLRHSDLVVAISQATLEEVRLRLESHPVQRERPLALSWMRLGSDFDALPGPLPAQGRDPGDTPTVLMVGTIEPRKGYAEALAALHALWADGHAVRLVVVGRPGWGPAELHRELAEAATREPLFEWRQDVGDTDLADLYRRADLLLAASEGEGFGLPLVEAARRGLPVLARDIPVFREVMGTSATYFTDGSPVGMGAAVLSALTSPEAVTTPVSHPWSTTAHDVVEALEGRRIDTSWTAPTRGQA